MNWKKEVRSIFLRSLAIFMAFWLVSVFMLTANNRGNMKELVADKFDSPHRTNLLNVQAMIESGTAEDQDGRIARQIMPQTGFRDSVVGLARVYDSQGSELGRSQITNIYITVEGQGLADYYLLADSVLTDEEQIYLAETMQREWNGDSIFWGLASGKINGREGWDNQGLYGEVTGILDGEDICPQKLTFYYEDHTVTLIDSDHSMFDDAELITLRFDSAWVSSLLASRYRSAENMLELYRGADAAIQSIGVTLSPNVGTSVFLKNGRCHTAVDNETGVPYVWAYAYDSFPIATYGLEMSYVSTFLMALIAAVLVARGQIKTLKKERQVTRAVAHEIKTPAAVLRATAEALSEGAAPERQQEYLSSMVEESDRLAFMVSELLDLSRMEGSSAALKRQRVDLTALTEGTFERLRPAMKQRALDLRLDLQPVTVSGDPKRLEQAVNNLAVNVLEHAQEGPVNVFLSAQGERAILTVGNAAPPLTGEQLRHLWEPFWKLDESRSGTGSGLGLAVVKNVVTLHGGTCSARTTSGCIEFRIELPVGAG